MVSILADQALPPAVFVLKLFWVLLTLVLIISLLGRVYLSVMSGYPSVDGVHYIEQSRQFVSEGTLPRNSFPPGWPLIVSIPLSMMDMSQPVAPLRAAQVANAILGTALGFLCVLLLRRRFDQWIALLGATVLLLIPQMITLSKSDLSEMSYACAILGAWLLIDRDRRFWAGLILGYAYVIRPEAILIALGLGLAFLSRDRRLPWQFGLAVAVSVLPFLVFLRVSRGAWALTSKSGFLTKSIEANPGWSFFELIGRNLVDFLPQLPELVGFPLVALAIWAVVRRPGRWLFFLMPLATLPLFSFRLEARYWAPYLPFFFFAAGIGLRELVVMMPEARRRVAAVALLVIMVGGVAWAAIDDWESVYSVNEAYEGMRDAGLWLRDEVDRDTRVAAYKPYVPFWADCTFVKYSKEPMTTKQLIETARMDGAEYLVVNVNVAQRLVPPLRPLLSNPPPHLAEMVTLIKIFSYEGRPVQNTAIYRINKPLHSEVTSPRR